MLVDFINSGEYGPQQLSTVRSVLPPVKNPPKYYEPVLNEIMNQLVARHHPLEEALLLHLEYSESLGRVADFFGKYLTDLAHSKLPLGKQGALWREYCKAISGVQEKSPIIGIIEENSKSAYELGDVMLLGYIATAQSIFYTNVREVNLF